MSSQPMWFVRPATTQISLRKMPIVQNLVSRLKYVYSQHLLQKAGQFLITQSVYCGLEHTDDEYTLQLMILSEQAIEEGRNDKYTMF